MPFRLFLVGLLLLTALGLGLVGYQATRTPNPAPVAEVQQAPPQIVSVDVLVAAHNLPAGTLMRAEDLIKRSIPSGQAPNNALIDTAETRADLRGALLRHYLDSGAILVVADVLHPRDRGFLAAVLAPGARAISVGVDPVTGTGGLIWPGDRVDVILTQQFDDKAPLAKRIVGETILDDVRVVAVDQNIAQGAVAGGDTTTGRQARTVTLEVTPQEAERAAVAERLGTITLAVHSADASKERTASASSIYGGDVSPALAGSEQAGAPVTRVRVVEGKDAREVTFQ